MVTNDVIQAELRRVEDVLKLRVQYLEDQLRVLTARLTHLEERLAAR